MIFFSTEKKPSWCLLQRQKKWPYKLIQLANTHTHTHMWIKKWMRKFIPFITAYISSSCLLDKQIKSHHQWPMNETRYIYIFCIIIVNFDLTLIFRLKLNFFFASSRMKYLKIFFVFAKKQKTISTVDIWSCDVYVMCMCVCLYVSISFINDLLKSNQWNVKKSETDDKMKEPEFHFIIFQLNEWTLANKWYLFLFVCLFAFHL